MGLPMLSLLWSAVAARLPAPLELSNAAVRVRFDGETGELLSLVNLLGDTADDYLTNLTQPAAAAAARGNTREQQPFCAQGSGGSFYIKTGGDPSVKSGWKGPPVDRCCRAKDATGVSHSPLAHSFPRITPISLRGGQDATVCGMPTRLHALQRCRSGAPAASPARQSTHLSGAQ